MSRQVIFGRINRRPGDLGDPDATFKDSLELMMEIQPLDAKAGTRTWVASDLRFDASGDFITGIVGFRDSEAYFQPDDDNFSWAKAPQLSVSGGTPRTVVPFAVDCRPEHQWIAFAQAHRVRGVTFRSAMTVLLTASAARAGLMPIPWEVDAVTERESLLDFLIEHPDLVRLERIVKMPNPRSDQLAEDRRRMLELGAGQLHEAYTPPRGGELNSDAPLIAELLEDIEYGYAEVKLVSGRGDHVVRFNSATRVSEALIPEYGSDLERGAEFVLAKLVEWVQERREHVAAP